MVKRSAPLVPVFIKEARLSKKRLMSYNKDKNKDKNERKNQPSPRILMVGPFSTDL
jgi:hypothetical protein